MFKYVCIHAYYTQLEYINMDWEPINKIYYLNILGKKNVYDHLNTYLGAI